MSIFAFEHKTIEKLPSSQASFIKKFLQNDADATGKLRHPSFLSAAETFRDEGGIMVFATKECTPLVSILSKCKLSLTEIQAGLLDIAEGLEFLHNVNKMAHLSVCPQSIFVLPNGRWVLGGLGYSTSLGPDGFCQRSNILDGYDNLRPSDAGSCLGPLPSLRYVAPEVVHGASMGYMAGPKSDGFSLGLVAAELLSIANNNSSGDNNSSVSVLANVSHGDLYGHKAATTTPGVVFNCGWRTQMETSSRNVSPSVCAAVDGLLRMLPDQRVDVTSLISSLKGEHSISLLRRVDRLALGDLDSLETQRLDVELREMDLGCLEKRVLATRILPSLCSAVAQAASGANSIAWEVTGGLIKILKFLLQDSMETSANDDTMWQGAWKALGASLTAKEVPFNVVVLLANELSFIKTISERAVVPVSNKQTSYSSSSSTGSEMNAIHQQLETFLLKILLVPSLSAIALASTKAFILRTTTQRLDQYIPRIIHIIEGEIVKGNTTLKFELASRQRAAVILEEVLKEGIIPSEILPKLVIHPLNVLAMKDIFHRDPLTTCAISKALVALAGHLTDKDKHACIASLIILLSDAELCQSDFKTYVVDALTNLTRQMASERPLASSASQVSFDFPPLSSTSISLPTNKHHATSNAMCMGSKVETTSFASLANGDSFIPPPSASSALTSGEIKTPQRTSLFPSTSGSTLNNNFMNINNSGNSSGAIPTDDFFGSFAMSSASNIKPVSPSSARNQNDLFTNDCIIPPPPTPPSTTASTTITFADKLAKNRAQNKPHVPAAPPSISRNAASSGLNSSSDFFSGLGFNHSDTNNNQMIHSSTQNTTTANSNSTSTNTNSQSLNFTTSSYSYQSADPFGLSGLTAGMPKQQPVSSGFDAFKAFDTINSNPTPSAQNNNFDAFSAFNNLVPNQRGNGLAPAASSQKSDLDMFFK